MEFFAPLNGRSQQGKGAIMKERTRNTFALAFVVAAASLAGGCATTEVAGDYVPPPTGSTWSTLQRSTGSYGTGEVVLNTTSGEQAWDGRQFRAFRNAQATILAEPASGRWAAFLAPDGRVLARFDPPIGFDWPLVVGKEMKSSYRMISATGASVAVQGQCRVENYADTSVKAGTFKTFRVGCANSIGQTEVYWYAPALGIFVKSSVMRTAANPAGAGTRDTEMTAVNIRR
jgi:hypothetical protein